MLHGYLNSTDAIFTLMVGQLSSSNCPFCRMLYSCPAPCDLINVIRILVAGELDHVLTTLIMPVNTEGNGDDYDSRRIVTA